MKAHWKYLKYLLKHKWFVFIAGRATGVSLWRLIIHDWSKFLPCEWFPYARYFYGNRKWYEWVDATGKYLPGFSGRGLQQLKGEFDLAWLHHQHFNPHHWQHWVLREDSGDIKLLEMPEHFMREMLADWQGAGRAITGRWEAREWYRKNREIIQLHPKTRAWIDSAIGFDSTIKNGTVIATVPRELGRVEQLQRHCTTTTRSPWPSCWP